MSGFLLIVTQFLITFYHTSSASHLVCAEIGPLNCSCGFQDGQTRLKAEQEPKSSSSNGSTPVRSLGFSPSEVSMDYYFTLNQVAI